MVLSLQAVLLRAMLNNVRLLHAVFVLSRLAQTTSYWQGSAHVPTNCTAYVHNAQADLKATSHQRLRLSAALHALLSDQHMASASDQHAPCLLASLQHIMLVRDLVSFDTSQNVSCTAFFSAKLFKTVDRYSRRRASIMPRRNTCLLNSIKQSYSQGWACNLKGATSTLQASVYKETCIC